MSARPLLFVLLAGLAGVSIAQSGSYSSTFSDYQPWRDGAPADWKAVNRTVASADAHANHGAPAAAGHDHGGTGGTGGAAGNHDHGSGPSGMADMHRKMHGEGKDHDMSAMHEKMHGKAGGHDMSTMHGRMHGGPRAGGHDHGADAGKKP